MNEENIARNIREDLHVTIRRLAEISAVCLAISREADENNEVRTLAGLGRYLADDWIGTIEAMLENNYGEEGPA